MNNNNNYSNNDPSGQGNIRDYQGNSSPLNDAGQMSAPGGMNDQSVTNSDMSQQVPQTQPQPDASEEMSRNFSSSPQSASSQYNASPDMGNAAADNPQMPNNPVDQVPYNKPFNFMKFAFIFLVLVVLVVGGYLGYKYFLAGKKTAPAQNATSPTVTQQPSQEVQDQIPTSTSPASTVPNNDNPNQETIDFSKCNPGDGYSRSVPMGSTYLSVVDVDAANGICHTEILNEVEGGFVKYSCNIPKTLGSVTFTLGDTGSDFTPITTYCTELKSGGSDTTNP